MQSSRGSREGSGIAEWTVKDGFVLVGKWWYPLPVAYVSGKVSVRNKYDESGVFKVFEVEGYCLSEFFFRKWSRREVLERTWERYAEIAERMGVKQGEFCACNFRNGEAELISIVDVTEGAYRFEELVSRQSTLLYYLKRLADEDKEKVLRGVQRGDLDEWIWEYINVVEEREEDSPWCS